MHQGYNDLETIIEDEFLDENFESEPILHDNYGIEINECYQIDTEHFEPDKAIDRFHEIPDESNFKEPAITELENDLEIIRVLPTNHPKILRYFDPT